jgi:predicted enzyme related to lactoylglutathione lyase
MAGQVVHLEFVASDIDRAQEFWNGLFEWGLQDSGMPEMDYRMADAGGGQGVALYKGEPGQPKFYLDTPNIDVSIAKARALGGHADEKMPVPGHGWFAAAQDTEGNTFHLWQADPSAGAAGEAGAS